MISEAKVQRKSETAKYLAEFLVIIEVRASLWHSELGGD